MGNTVKIIGHKDVVNAGITPKQCIDWVVESFKMKYESCLPPKISIHPQGDDFFNTMPCLLPKRYGRFTMKEVHRIAGQEPALGSDILIYDAQQGKLLAIMDGDWITNMRTGAVAALSARMFKPTGCNEYSFIGLGNTARATALCILEDNADCKVKFRLLKYKNQADLFMDRFRNYDNLEIEIVDDIEILVTHSQVLISCITSANGIMCPNDSLFPLGLLLIPVHTRGFQNCDLFFDKIYGDDTGHVQGFKYFSRFKKYDELSQVLIGNNPGRENDSERIICYNIGLGLHDAVFSCHIYDMLASNLDIPHFIQDKETSKFWI